MYSRRTGSVLVITALAAPSLYSLYMLFSHKALGSSLATGFHWFIPVAVLLRVFGGVFTHPEAYFESLNNKIAANRKRMYAPNASEQVVCAAAIQLWAQHVVRFVARFIIPKPRPDSPRLD